MASLETKHVNRYNAFFTLVSLYILPLGYSLCSFRVFLFHRFAYPILKQPHPTTISSIRRLSNHPAARVHEPFHHARHNNPSPISFRAIWKGTVRQIISLMPFKINILDSLPLAIT